MTAEAAILFIVALFCNNHVIDTSRRLSNDRRYRESGDSAGRVRPVQGVEYQVVMRQYEIPRNRP